MAEEHSGSNARQGMVKGIQLVIVPFTKSGHPDVVIPRWKSWNGRQSGNCGIYESAAWVIEELKPLRWCAKHVTLDRGRGF
jgi:hypothetical protein